MTTIRPARPGDEEHIFRLLAELARFEKLEHELTGTAEALALHCVLGFTIAEIAEATGAPPNTVRGRLVSAKQTLRSVLADDAELNEQLRDWSRGAG